MVTDERRALAWAMAAILLWATLAAATGDALKKVPAATLVLWAFVFATPTLLAAERLRGRTLRALLVAPPRVYALGLLGLFGYHALFFTALERAPIVPANLLNYLWPLFMVLLAPLARERVGRLTLLGAVVGFAGAGLVVTQGKGLELSREHATGYVLAGLAALAWSGFSVLLRRSGEDGRMPAFAVGSLAVAFAWAASRGELALPRPAWAATAWLGVGPMALAFICWSKALSQGSAARIGVLSYLDPLLSTLVVSFVLGEPISGWSWAGMILIVLGAAGPSLVSASRPAGT